MSVNLLTGKRSGKNWSISISGTDELGPKKMEPIKPMAMVVLGAFTMGVGLLVQRVGTVLHAPKFEKTAGNLCILGGAALGTYGIYKDQKSKR